MAIEDAAVLGTLLSHISLKAQLPQFVKAYEELRIPRATAMQNESRLNQHYVHMEDGPEQEKRDAGIWNVFSGEKENGSSEETKEPSQTAVAGSAEASATDSEGKKLDENEKQKVASHFGYDAVGDAERWWQEIGIETIGKAHSTSSAL